MSELAEWLETQIAEDERDGCACRFVDEDREVCDQRIRAECQAKRAIIRVAFAYGETVDSEWGCCHRAEDLRRGYVEDFDGERDPIPEGCCAIGPIMSVLRPLALPYAECPGFREEWRRP